MKSSSKLVCLFGLGLLSTLCMIVSFSVATDNNQGVDMNLSSSDFSVLKELATANKARLIRLFLLESVNDTSGKTPAYMAVNNSNILDIYNGLVVSKQITARNNQNNQLVVIGGGEGNKISGGGSETNPRKNSGIAGGKGNEIEADNAAIGGGESNHVSSEGGVVAGGQGNTSNGGVVLGGQSNTSNGGIVLGGKSNEAGENGLAMGQNAKGGEGFLRNDGTVSMENSNSSFIGATNGVLIGKEDISSKAGVSLVVDGAIKVGTNMDENGAKLTMKDGCIYSYDTKSWHKLGGGNCGGVEVAQTCKFGRVELQQGDVVEAYSKTVAEKGKCENFQRTVVCTGGKLVADDLSGDESYKYPSCFDLNSQPFIIN